jgi:uncharacterized protein YcfL
MHALLWIDVSVCSLFENACKVIVRVSEQLYWQDHQIVTIALSKLDSNIYVVSRKQVVLFELTS